MQLKFSDNTTLDGLENATVSGTTVKLEFLADHLKVEQLLEILQSTKMDTFYIVNGETTSAAYLHFVNIIGVVGIDPVTNRIVATMGQKDAADVRADEQTKELALTQSALFALQAYVAKNKGV